MKTITIGCWENDRSPLTSSSDYPLMTKNVLLLYDLTSFKTDMKSAVFYKDGRCVLTSRTTRALFSDLEMQFGMSYAQSKAITQLLTRISTKVPYAINELLYFEIKDKASSHSHWCAFHHLTQTIQENRQTSLILSNCLQIILPYCQKTVEHQLATYRIIQHAHETVACSIIDNLTHATVETQRSREITSVPFHKPTEFLRTPMSLNDTMHLMRNVFCDYIEHHKSIYMEPRDLAKLRRLKN